MSSKTIGQPEEARTFSIVRLEPGARGPLVVAEPPPAVTVRPGDTFGKYEIVRLLRESGTGETFEAVHTDSRKSVAIKIMNPGRVRDSALESLLLRQAEALSRVKHPHVIEVTDYGMQKGLVFLATELLAGEDLGAAIARAPAGLDPAWSTDVLLAACAGVSAGHACGVAHHNLKPESILLCGPATDPPSPKVLDFGVASLLATRSHGLTSAGSGRGTVFFLSPEQVRGEPGDVRSDEYALAVILYHCLTGRVPHQGDSSFAIMSSISSGHFPPPRELRPDLPPALEAVVLRAMASQPTDRFATVHELGRALLGFASSSAQERWSSHFLGAPGPAVPLLTRQPVEPKPRLLETSIFPAINQGPVPTLIGYRLAPDAAAEKTERLARSRPVRWRRTAIAALVLGSVAGALLSFVPPHLVVEGVKRAIGPWTPAPLRPPAPPEPPARAATAPIKIEPIAPAPPPAEAEVVNAPPIPAEVVNAPPIPAEVVAPAPQVTEIAAPGPAAPPPDAGVGASSDKVVASSAKPAVRAAKPTTRSAKSAVRSTTKRATKPTKATKRKRARRSRR